ncbi:MAG: hypothetical protein HY064_16920 [Bacteroidetes bacterium]|nr:hypothetical protein [Bacteroidota bacterium]
MKSNPVTGKDHYRELVDARLKIQGDDSHYLETVLEHNGMQWVNHSIATSVDMTWFALRDIPGPVTLIIGGTDRADDHHKLIQFVSEKVQVVIALGSTPWKYFNAFEGKTKTILKAENLHDAIALAALYSDEKIKTILFSPSCPSYDAFDNYRNRGDRFRELVKKLHHGN